MKSSMIFAVVMLAVIILMASFGSPFATQSALNVPESMLDNVLYLCPAASNGWDSAAEILSNVKKPLMIAFFFGLIILLFSWGWALYQNLLKDKFEQKSFSNAWGMTKIFFWGVVIALLAIWTPNHFRTVHIQNYSGDYVLCESDSHGAMAVRQNAVISANKKN